MLSETVDIFESHRSRLLGLAYRITGSVSEAEDIVQETFLKWRHADYKTIQSPSAWLMKVATRLALDYMKSARVERVSYVGPWLPEPFVDNELAMERELTSVVSGAMPDKEMELDQSISMALLVLLEELSAAERASFILHDLFHFDFEEIADILEKTESTCRKLASRARLKIGRDTLETKQYKDGHLKMVAAFFQAVKSGNMTALITILKEDVVMRADGGGKAIALLEMLHGPEAVAEFLLAKVRPAINSATVTTRMIWFNGSPGLIVRDGGKPVTAFNFGVENGVIKKIHALRNPDKLRLFDSR